MSGKWALYIRRSSKREGDADVSDETQERVARTRIPADAVVEVYSDSGGHNSGFTTERPAYQRMLADLRSGKLAGISAYNQSRLNRNAENDLGLLRECATKGVRLSVGDGDGEQQNTANGQLVYGIQAVVSQNYRDQMRDMVTSMMQTTFENGGPRGHDPFGYETRKDERFRVVRPRTLVIVEREAEVVRRVFRELATHPLSEVADMLNREGVQHRTPRPWTTSSVKDLLRRAPIYRGFVVKKRGLDTRPGTHEAILDEPTFRAAMAGVEGRKRQRGPKPRGVKRLYLLRGLMHCSCTARMRGCARVARGKDWRYYVCPVAEERSAIFGPDGQPIICPEHYVRAEAAEALVLSAVARLALPDEAVREARAELRRRLRAPTLGLVDKERTRLHQRIENLRKQHGWGDISDATYRSERASAESQLAELSDHDKLLVFDRHREVMASMPDALANATPEQLQQLVAKLIERVETANRKVVRIVWSAPARPFFASGDLVADGNGVLQERPQGDSNP
jgi:DNA invertase Pin-like site-specific DNA recombinase